MPDEVLEKEYITEKEVQVVKELFKKNLQSYKEKDAYMTDKEWLEELFNRELSGIISPKVSKQDAEEIVEAIKEYDENLKSVNEAAQNGVSKENWLAGKLEEASASMAVNKYGKRLQSIDDMLYQKNMELAEALKRSSDGHIKMSPNLDGNIAEHMIADTTELSGFVQGKNIKVEVREAYTANSVDVRAIDAATGRYQNYQLKFGQDAKTTITLIERGNYNNQRIVVPKEQLEEVQAHFKAIGSDKTITDHIEAFGAVGKSFTKEEMKAIQTDVQEKSTMPELDYGHIHTKDMVMDIGKNTGVLALQSMAVTTGLTIIGKLFKGEPVDNDELVESAIKTGADTSVKVVTAGTLKVAVDKGGLSLIPKTTPAGVIANIACVGIENAKILWKIATGELSLTKGIDNMGRTTTSMVGGLCGMAEGAFLTSLIPIVGPVLGVATGVVGGLIGYFAGSKIGDCIYSAGKAVSKAAIGIAKTAWEGVKAVGRDIKNFIKGVIFE